MDDWVEEELRRAVEEGRSYKKPWIHPIGEDILAKGKDTAKKEFEWGIRLNEEGVNVPQFYNLIGKDSFLSRLINPSAPLKNDYIVMERVEKRDLLYVPEEYRKEAAQKYRDEILKVIDMGICPRDSCLGNNAIYDPEEDEITLIDFERWYESDDQEELGKYRGLVDWTVNTLMQNPDILINAYEKS